MQPLAIRFARVVLSLAVVCATALPALRQELSELSLPPNGSNQKAEVSQWIGVVKVTIAYHSPNVHGGGGGDRTGHIWGDLLRYGFFDEGFGPSRATPWRAGANESTTIAFSHDVKIAGKDLRAGTYALFLELEPNAPWSWIFSTQSTGWGSYQYDPANDALRVPVAPEPAPYTEFLTYGFDERRPDSAVAYLQWENKRVAFKIDVPNVNDLYVAQMRKELLGWPGFNYQNWQTAAQFCADHKINLDEALVWADKAIKEPFKGAAQGREDFSTLQTKAAVLHAMGRGSEADVVMDKALHIPGTAALPIHRYAATLVVAGRNEKAMEVYRLNRELHPDDTFVTFVGLARGYTAIGDRKHAIANWELALRNIPDDQKQNRPIYEKALKALKDSQ
jgi:tetratricopeptide (TPR) repeat protein